MVQSKLAYADVNGRKRRQSSTMLNFQGQRKLTLAFQPIRKASQGHREPTHCSATAIHGRIRWPVYSLLYARRNLRWNTLVAAAQRLRSAWKFASANGRKKYKPSLTPNKWPKHKRKNLRKIWNGAWAYYIVLRRCQTNVLPSSVYQENIISNDLKKRVIFSLSKMCLTLMCISFITRVVLILGYFFVSKSVAPKDHKKGLESNGTQLLYQQLY